MSSDSLPTYIYYTSKFLKHHTGQGHPECPARLLAILDALESNKNLSQQLAYPSFQAIADEDILLAHEADYFELACSTIKQGYPQLPTGDTMVSKDSLEATKLASGAVLSACLAVLQKQSKSAFCLVRPPGHHATVDRGMGFCVFNHIAIAAKVLLKRYGLQRIAIVDFDVHHGNGTQDIFYDDDKVFYLSIHEKDIYPGTGKASETGYGKGQGFTLNIEMPKGANDSDALQVMKNIIAPAIRIYQPEFILVSAGFDAHQEDSLGHLNYTAKGYGELSQVLLELAKECCENHIIFALEGGYHLNALSKSIVTVMQTIRTFK